MWTDEVDADMEKKTESLQSRVLELRNWWSARRCRLALENTSKFKRTVPNEVIRGKLWIGCADGAERLDAIPAIKAVVTLHSRDEIDYPYKRAENCVLYYVQIQDASDQNMYPHFDAATQFMHDHILAGRGVYVHCEAGVSRSATLCIAYLIRFLGMSLDQAFMVVHCARPIISPNHGFVRQLELYEKEKSHA